MATINGYITAAFNNKEWLILDFHDILAVASGSIQLSTAKFQTLMDFINTTGIPVRLISQVLKSG
jgi:hypothetical protein